MAWTANAVENYDSWCISPNTEAYAGVYAFIRLHWQSRHRATLFFYRDGVTIPSNSSVTSGGVTIPYIRFGQAQYRDCIDLLRNEKPVYFQWDDASKGAMLATGSEPVGETETS